MTATARPLGIIGVALLATLSPPLVAQEGSFGRTRLGLGVGVTVTAIATTAMLTSGDGNACSGSGDYLQLCRAIFVGSTAVGAGLGAIVGSTVRRAAPAGPAASVLLGSALGAMAAFVVSLPACSQEDPTNPRWLCGHHGMTQPETVIIGAAAGGVVGYLLGRSSSFEVTRIGPVPGESGGPAMGVAFRSAWD